MKMEDWISRTKVNWTSTDGGDACSVNNWSSPEDSDADGQQLSMKNWTHTDGAGDKKQGEEVPIAGKKENNSSSG